MNHVVQRGWRWKSHHQSSPTIATMTPQRIVGVRDDRSPDSPLIVVACGVRSVPGLGGSGVCPVRQLELMP